MGCESLIVFKPFRDGVDKPDIRGYISIQFIYSFIGPGSALPVESLIHFLSSLEIRLINLILWSI